MDTQPLIPEAVELIELARKGSELLAAAHEKSEQIQAKVKLLANDPSYQPVSVDDPSHPKPIPAAPEM